MAHRILSLDGGGAWALLEAMCLKDMFGDIPGRKILAQFDMAVANSGGSIVLAGLVLDFTPSQIIALFQDRKNREAIFVSLSWFSRQLAGVGVFPRYSTEKKLVGLRQLGGAGGDRPLAAFAGKDWIKGPGGEDVRILIVALDYDGLRASFFRNYGTVHGAQPETISLMEAVHASSNAPVTYFDHPALGGGHRSWDGAMAGLNNPLLAGVIDFMGEGAAAKDLIALSIGTGTIKLAPTTALPAPPKDLSQPAADDGVLSNVKRAAGCILDDPPDTSVFSSHTILASARGADPKNEGGVVRLNATVRPVLNADKTAWTLPRGLTAPDFQALLNLDMDAVKDEEVALIARLGNAWLQDTVPNQPIRMRPEDLSSSLGEELYSDAKARWFDLAPPPKPEIGTHTPADGEPTIA